MIPYAPYRPDEAPQAVADRLLQVHQQRRSVRDFSDRPVPQELIETLVRMAGTAPSGANKQPWRFVCVSDPALKARIRAGAEEEERLFYGKRASDRWLKDLEPFGTDENKPFLETVPWLIVVFKLTKGDDGSQVYYLNESVGLATGLLISAIHQVGLATLTHTPSPMRFLTEILDRPRNEKPFLLLPVGYPADDCQVPDIERKTVDDILVWR